MALPTHDPKLLYRTSFSVTCRFCRQKNGLPGTRMCDACWELDMRIRSRPHIARKILAQYDRERHPGDEPDRGSLSPAVLKKTPRKRTRRLAGSVLL